MRKWQPSSSRTCESAQSLRRQVGTVLILARSMIDAGQVEEEEEQESGRRANGRRTNGEEGNSAQRIEAIKRKLRSDIEKAAGSALRDD